MKRTFDSVTVSFAALLVVILNPFESGHAQQLEIVCDGVAAPNISAENEPGDIVGGSGNTGPGGISLDLETGLLSIDVEWGSGNGHVDLSSNVTLMNIHGPTEGFAPANYQESAGVLTGLEGFDPSAVSGGFVGEVQLGPTEIRQLLEGRFYLHLHTEVNGDGEARGYLIPATIVGDANEDGAITLADIPAFVSALASGEFLDEADINRDGEVSLADIPAFVDLLAG